MCPMSYNLSASIFQVCFASQFSLFLILTFHCLLAAMHKLFRAVPLTAQSCSAKRFMLSPLQQCQAALKSRDYQDSVPVAKRKAFENDLSEVVCRRALDLVYALVNDNNIKSLTKELLEYLKVSDTEFKPDLTAKICQLVLRFAPDKRWHFDSILQVAQCCCHICVFTKIIEVLQGAQALFSPERMFAVPGEVGKPTRPTALQSISISASQT